MDAAIIAFIFFLLAVIIGYYIILTLSLIKVCRENSTNWIIIMVACYFIGLLGVIPLCFYWFGEEVAEEQEQAKKKSFNLGSQVKYALKNSWCLQLPFWLSLPTLPFGFSAR